MDYSFYDVNTGTIVNIYNGASPYLQSNGISTGFVDGESNPNIHYISNGIITDRPSQTYAISKTTITHDGIDEAVISGIRSGAIINISGPVSNVIAGDGTDLHFTAALHGDYTIQVIDFPYLDWSTIIHAV